MSVLRSVVAVALGATFAVPALGQPVRQRTPVPVPPPPPFEEYVPVPGGVTPTASTYSVMPEDARYFYFDVDRFDQNDTGAFQWGFAGQDLDLRWIYNLTEIAIDVDGATAADAPFDSQSDITLTVTQLNNNQPPTDIVLRSFAAGQPLAVSLGGMTYPNPTPGIWSWDGPSMTVTLIGQIPQQTDWVVDVP